MEARVMLVWFLIATFVDLAPSTSAATASSYRAAVFEHVRFGELDSSVEEVLSKNLKSYAVAAATASKHGADIIVFPEFGIFPHTKLNRSVARNFAEDVPDPKRMGIPCNPCEQADLYQNRVVLHRLSCLAKENRLFLVANMVDKKACEATCDADGGCTAGKQTCPEDGLFLHNTNVVFDRSGNLITRYYKRHLYFEFDLNDARRVQHEYFQTEFGNFTTFVCFDMSFYESVDSVSSSGVLNVAYPTYWYDHQPFAVATQFQQAWAMTHKVNLLAANAHLPGTGTMGSGIFSGSKGALVYTHSPDGRDKLLIADVPTTPGDLEVEANPRRFIIDGEEAVEEQQETPEFLDHCAREVLGEPQDLATDYRCAHTDVSVYHFVKLQGKSGSIDVCSGGELCCHLDYEADSMDEDYSFGSYSGVFNLSGAFGFGTQACLLTRCEGTPCQFLLASSDTVFRHVKISAQFSTPHVYPSVLYSGFVLAPRDTWSYDQDHGLKYKYSDGDYVKSPLLSAGLYARMYDRDTVL